MYQNKFAPVLLVAILLAANIVTYSQHKTILQLAGEYEVALKKYEAGQTRTSVERVIRKGKAAASRLEEMEKLSDKDYSRLKRRMRGFEINREEVLYIVPDAKFFARLVKTHGTSADRAYFALMRQLRPDDVWSAYIEQLTDVTGCTRYGGIISPLYGKALRFKRTYPNAYTRYVNEEIEDILDTLRERNCACADQASVEKELRLFIRSFPNDKNTPAIRARLESLKKGSDFRYDCRPG